MSVGVVLLDVVLALLELLETACNNDDLRAGLRVEERGGGADTGRSAGDDSDLVFVGLAGKVRCRIDERVNTACVDGQQLFELITKKGSDALVHVAEEVAFVGIVHRVLRHIDDGQM